MDKEESRKSFVHTGEEPYSEKPINDLFKDAEISKDEVRKIIDNSEEDSFSEERIDELVNAVPPGFQYERGIIREVFKEYNENGGDE